MEQKPKNILTGCLIWSIGFLIISSCLVPAGMLAGGLTMYFSEDLLTSTIGQLMCPTNTIPEIISFESTRIDEDGFTRPSITFEMVCKTPDGTNVTNLGGMYALIWNGIFVVVSIILTAVLLIVLTIIFLRIFRTRDNLKNLTPLLVKIQ
jgi:hypothetical protein